MHRATMIGQLTASTIASTLDKPDVSWLWEILKRGFIGYGNMSDEALRREMQLRGLLRLDAPATDEELGVSGQDEEFDDDAVGDDDDEDESVLMAAAVIAVDRAIIDA